MCRRPLPISRVPLEGLSFGEAVGAAKGSEALARAALLHMLWTHEVEADLSQVLCDKTILMAGAAR